MVAPQHSRKKENCEEVLRETYLFNICSPFTLAKICAKMSKHEFRTGEVIYKQGQEQQDMAVIASGKVQRMRMIKGQNHVLGVDARGKTLGSHHVMQMDPAGATCTCITPVKVYKLSTEEYKAMLKDEQVASDVVHSLNKEIRRQANLLHSPLLQQHPKPTPYFATSVAAGVESFYRSALNSALNAKLTGQRPTSLFPNMYVQVPSRVMYINGFKGIRHYLDHYVDVRGDEQKKTLIRLGVAITPGVLMTPVSSLLEACNAGHMNPEPLQTRWMRGLFPRTFREIIFGVGLNQLSDYFEERVTFVSNPFFRNATASIMAGMIAGYFSHIPHNLSTLKLMEPHKSYKQHVQELIQKSETRIPASYSPNVRQVMATALALVFPRGLTIRTTQIVGSFIILNGTITSLKDFDPLTYSKSLLEKLMP